MYIPKHFQEEDREKIIRFINQQGFGIITSSTDTFPVATHIPIVVKSQENSLWIHTHLAVNNTHSDFLKHYSKALLVIQGNHAYISPSLYESEDVPTWDYMSVHCEVEIHIPSDMDAIKDLHELVNNFEKNMPQPINPNNFSKSMMDAYLKYVFPFRLKILKMEAAWKLSQNRATTEKNNIKEFLKSQNNPLWKEI